MPYEQLVGARLTALLIESYNQLSGYMMAMAWGWGRGAVIARFMRGGPNTPTGLPLPGHGHACVCVRALCNPRCIDS